MSNPRTMQIQEISAHPGTCSRPRYAARAEVCKYIDVTTCIGCKACEVACVEWNDHPFRETTFDNTYQTMPSTEWNYWNLIKFAEDERDGNLMWLMRKDQCMHCEDPGCLRACPADGAIIKYENGIVDFQQEQLYRLWLLHLRLSVRHSQVQSENKESFQMHAVFRSRRSGTRTGLY